MNRTTHKLAIALVGLALVLVGCSSNSADPSPSNSEGGGSVRLLTYDSFAISDEMRAAFTAQTGYELEIIKAADAGIMLNRALLRKDSPEADVIFGVDNNLLSRATDENLFAPYAPAALADVNEDVQVAPDDLATPIDTGDVCINYDIAALEKAAIPTPTSLQDLTGDRYAKTLVVEDPAASSPGLAFLLATVAEFGEDKYLDYWRTLKENGVKVAGSWDDAYFGDFTGGSKKGKFPIVVSYASSPAAAMIADNPPKSAPTAALLSGCYQQIEFAGLLANAENEAGGKALIDFMLSGPYQESLPMTNFVYPVLQSSKLPAAFAKWARSPSDPLSLPSNEVAQNREKWVKAWTEVMQG